MNKEIIHTDMAADWNFSRVFRIIDIYFSVCVCRLFIGTRAFFKFITQIGGGREFRSTYYRSSRHILCQCSILCWSSQILVTIQLSQLLYFTYSCSSISFFSFNSAWHCWLQYTQTVSCSTRDRGRRISISSGAVNISRRRWSPLGKFALFTTNSYRTDDRSDRVDDASDKMAMQIRHRHLPLFQCQQGKYTWTTSQSARHSRTIDRTSCRSRTNKNSSYCRNV